MISDPYRHEIPQWVFMWDTIGSQSKTYSTHVFAWAGHNVKYRDVSKLGVQNSMTSFVDFDGPFWAFTQPYQLTNIRQFVAATRKALKRNVKVQTGRYFVNSSKRIKITLKQSSWAYNQPWIEKCNMWLKNANPTNVDCSRAWNALTIIPTITIYICNLTSLHLNRLSGYPYPTNIQPMKAWKTRCHHFARTER